MQLTEKDILSLEAVSHICPITNIAVNYIKNNLNRSNVAKTVNMYAMRGYQVIERSFLKGAERSGMFEKVFTEEGVCFTFNGLRNFDIFKEDS